MRELKIEKRALSSGVNLVAGVMPHTEAVTILYLFRVGSRNETDANAGVSHLFEHMLFKGTERYPTAREVAEVVEGVGGIFNAFTDREVTGYWCKMPLAQHRRGLEVISDMVRSPLLREEEIEREKQVVYEEIRAYNDSPSSKASLLLDGMLWEGHALGRDIAGSVESVGGIARSEMLRYLNSLYVAENMVAVVAGNVDADATAEFLEPLMSGYRRREGEADAAAPFAASQEEARVRAEERPIEQVRISLGVLGPSLEDEDRHAVSVCSAVLGESMSSRLFAEVRERRGLAYDISSGAHNLTDTGAVEVHCGVPPDKVEEALRVIGGELAKMASEEVTEKEHRNAQELIRGRMALRMEDSRAVAQFIGGQEILQGDVKTPEEVLEKVGAVTRGDVRAAAERYLRSGRASLAVVGAVGDGERLRGLLSF